SAAPSARRLSLAPGSRDRRPSGRSAVGQRPAGRGAPHLARRARARRHQRRAARDPRPPAGRAVTAPLVLRAFAAAAALSMVLAGCATVPPPETYGGETLSGRMSVRVEAGDRNEATSMTAAFELLGDPQRGQLDLATPLGTTLA